MGLGGDAVTDLATRSDADEASEPSSNATEVLDTPTSDTPGADAPVQWAPTEPAPKKKRLWAWIGVPTAIVAVGAVAASLVLIAPGTAVAGVPVGFMTAGAATDAISQRLAETTLVLGDGGPTVTGADLGATVDAKALADAAFADRPMWNVTQWFGDGVDATVTIDPAKTSAALRAALPSAFVDPTPAAVAFDGASFVVTPAVAGTGLDVDVLAKELHDAFIAGKTTVTIDPTAVPVEATASTANAQAAADKANALLGTVGFYVGDERTVPVDAATAASWLTVSPDAAGTFDIAADPTKIQPVVDTLAPLVDRAPVDGTVITNDSGTVLRTTVPGADGRALGDTGSVAKDFAAQLADGNGVFALPVTVTPATTTTLQRLLEVNLSEQRLYLKENGNVVDSWLISSGKDSPGSYSPTQTGRYRINSHYDVQTMSSGAGKAGTGYWDYEVPNIQWIMYFNGSQAFHGVYWHSNFGSKQSHGCVGMPNSRAKQIYEWAPNGVDVWVHN